MCKILSKIWVTFAQWLDASIPLYPLHFNLWYIVFLIEHSFCAIFGTTWVLFCLFYLYDKSFSLFNHFLEIVLLTCLTDATEHESCFIGNWCCRFFFYYYYEMNIYTTAIVRRHLLPSVNLQRDISITCRN